MQEFWLTIGGGLDVRIGVFTGYYGIYDEMHLHNEHLGQQNGVHLLANICTST